MALSQDDFVSAVARLNDLTRRQVIKWLPCSPPMQRPPATIRSAVEAVTASQWQPKVSFETIYDNRILRITQYESVMSLSSSGPFRYTLDVRDEDGNTVFEFPAVEGISDLFRSVQTQGLDIEGFIKKLATE
jgi:hypothetical protein